MPQFDARFVTGFFFRLLCAALFVYPCTVLLFNTTPLAVRFDEWPAQVLLALSALVFTAILILPRRTTAWRVPRKLILFWSAAFVLALPFALIKIIMGDNQIEPILIFLRGDNFGEVLAVGRGSYGGLLLRAAVLFTVLVALLTLLVRRYERMEFVVTALCVTLLLLHPVTNYAAGLLLPNPLQAAFAIEEHYSSPASATRTGAPKNLIIIYLESLEATFGRVPATAGGFAPLEALSERAYSAANIHQVEGTRYTIAGLVATQCGVPLVPYGLNDIGFDSRMAHSLETFMPGITCLGDVLSRDGYTVSYMNGASIERYSKRGFLTSHGYDRLFGLESVNPSTIVGRDNVFGMNDAMLFEHVNEELRHLQGLGQPFLLTVLTVGTHGPHGFPDRDCALRPGEIAQLAAAIRCSGEAIERLLETLDRTGLAETTLVAVMSDHLMINQQLIEAPALGKALHKLRDERRNLFFIYGVAPGISAKPASMIDVYPTLLTALGYRLEHDRANLGVSLFGDAPTLVQRYGERGVDKLFLQNLSLARELWNCSAR